MNQFNFVLRLQRQTNLKVQMQTVCRWKLIQKHSECLNFYSNAKHLVPLVPFFYQEYLIEKSNFWTIINPRNEKQNWKRSTYSQDPRKAMEKKIVPVKPIYCTFRSDSVDVIPFLLWLVKNLYSLFLCVGSHLIDILMKF